MLLSYGPEFVPELLTFKSDSLKLPKALNHEVTLENTKPAVWWQSAEQSEVSKKFCGLAVRLLDMPSNSAAIERVFSNFGFIQTKLRNRLGLEKASTLVYCNVENDW